MAIAFKEATQAALLAVVPICPKGVTVNLTSLHPNNRRRARDEGLQDAIDSDLPRNMMFDATGWNARPGPAVMAARHILGKFALGPTCVDNDCQVSSYRFQHARRYLVT